jgi:3-hydroxymyristoyl/3-hydroxydecanoyl-(acyl carrier protein) dehydratase
MGRRGGVRFLFYDRMLRMQAGRHALATRAISIGDEFLPEHYTRRPIMPASLILESLTQVAGWLYIVTGQFAISTVLGLVQGVEILGEGGPGDTLELEVWMQYGHRDGATCRGVVRVNGADILRAERLVFAGRPLTDPASIQESRELFRYLSGGLILDQGGGS